MSFGQYDFPKYEAEPGISLAEQLRRDARRGLEERLQAAGARGESFAGMREEYEERLATELEVIEKMGFPATS
jgi:DNA polymerase-3 subunit alpha